MINQYSIKRFKLIILKTIILSSVKITTRVQCIVTHARIQNFKQLASGSRPIHLISLYEFNKFQFSWVGRGILTFWKNTAKIQVALPWKQRWETKVTYNLFLGVSHLCQQNELFPSSHSNPISSFSSHLILRLV